MQQQQQQKYESPSQPLDQQQQQKQQQVPAPPVESHGRGALLSSIQKVRRFLQTSSDAVYFIAWVFI